MMQIVGIKFKEEGKIYKFFSEIELNKGDKVIVDTERGEQLGIVDAVDVRYDNSFVLKPIKSIASDKEYVKFLKNLSDAKKALSDTRELAKKMNLNMNLIDASYSLDKKHLFFNFVSDERIDFRELVKELATRYHARIELHQIGVRDKAKDIGGIGLCGRELCCSSHLNCINTININMVKNQDIALNPTKINGACGRLLCCFTYENDLYEENRKALPKTGQKIDYKGRKAEVISVDILNKKYKVKIDDNNIEEVIVDDKM